MTDNRQAQNMYVSEGQRRVRRLRACECFKKTGKKYYLRCRIQQRAKSALNALTYIYCGSAQKGSGFLQAENRPSDRYRIYLDDDARNTVQAAIEAFETQLEAVRSRCAVCFEFAGINFELHFKNIAADYFEFLLVSRAGKAETVTLYRDTVVREPISAIERMVCERAQRRQKAIDSEPLTLPEALYNAACRTEDEAIALLIKHYYKNTDASDVAALETIFGGRVLPPLSTDFNYYYTVNSATVDMELLRRSGYNISHRPAFAMRGCTYSKWKLNPARRFGIDFAGKDEAAIDFDEFLKLFEAEHVDNSGPRSGVFWVIGGQLRAYTFDPDAPVYPDYIEKSGNTYDHAALWQAVNGAHISRPYNYYPRGRVVLLANGETVVYMNPSIDMGIVPAIMQEFRLSKVPEVKYDYSAQYRCHLDDMYDLARGSSKDILGGSYCERSKQ